MKAATYYAYAYSNRNSISIHAAREGGDGNKLLSTLLHAISIHAAREGGDVNIRTVEDMHLISIHAAREGGDPATHIRLNYDVLFQSTPPVKAATDKPDTKDKLGGISIHAAREGGDGRQCSPTQLICISIHAAREGGD